MFHGRLRQKLEKLKQGSLGKLKDSKDSKDKKKEKDKEQAKDKEKEKPREKEKEDKAKDKPREKEKAKEKPREKDSEDYTVVAVFFPVSSCVKMTQRSPPDWSNLGAFCTPSRTEGTRNPRTWDRCAVQVWEQQQPTKNMEEPPKTAICGRENDE